MQDLFDILKSFDPITLQEMDSVQLLERVDTKYTFHIRQLPDFLEKMKPFYRVLDVKDVRINRYETIYFDTDDFRLYRHHHNGKQNRYKVRYRCYTDTLQSFFEVKFKSNKDRTRKQRIKRNEIKEIIENETEDFVKAKSNIDPKDLSAKMWVYFSRMTLVNKTANERLTIDINLNFKNNDASFPYPVLVIAEVKQGKSCNSPFTRLMKENHIMDDAISKYCLGVASLVDNVKKNRFKYKLLSINKLCHAKA